VYTAALPHNTNRRICGSGPLLVRSRRGVDIEGRDVDEYDAKDLYARRRGRWIRQRDFLLSLVLFAELS
jgi:hypothetical protein